MRRIALVLLLTLGMLAAALGSTVRSGSTAQAAEIAPIAAVSADSLVDGYGVGIHLAFLDTPYQDASAVANALSNLGVRHVRDDLFMNNPRQYAGIKTVADKGITFDLIMGKPTSLATPSDYVDTVATKLPAGSVESLEGTNEWDISGRPDWVTEMLTRQQQLYTAAKANPATAALPVLSPALAYRWNYAMAGDLSKYADEANAHMYPGGYPPSNEVTRITTALRGSISSKPLVVTEAGYHNAVSTTNGHLPVPEDVAAVYTPRLLLEHYLRGAKRVYTYELIDEFDDAGLTNPEAHFGLLRRDLTPKPAYTAMKTLLGLVSDPGVPFTPGSLPFKVEGAGSDARYVLTQKRNGQFVLFLWRDTSVYDPITRQPIAVAPTSATLRLAKSADLKVYRPTEGSTPVAQVSASSMPLKLDGQVTAITIDASKDVPPPPYNLRPCLPPDPQNVTTTAGNKSATVAWQLPQTTANVTGFDIVRQPGAVSLWAPPAARSIQDSNLVNGTSYSYTVRTVSPDGSSVPIKSPAVVPATVPTAPAISTITGGTGSATITWKKPSDQGRAISAYQVVSGSKTLNVSAAAVRATLTGLPKKTTVKISLRARNAIGWSAWTARTVKTK